MNTRKMELTMSEMENVCGGGFWDIVLNTMAKEFQNHQAEGHSTFRTVVEGGVTGTFTGIAKAINSVRRNRLKF